MRTNQYSTLAVCISLCLAAPAIQAGGFGLTVQSASGGGNSATGHAMAEDASVMWYNPALLSSVEGTQINGGLSLVNADLTVQDTGSRLPDLAGGTLVNDGDVAEPGGLSIAPSLFYKRDVGNMAFGLGINVPFGVSSEYEKDSFARYEATESQLATININPALSWRINNKLDIGAGLNLQYGTATLSKSVDAALACQKIVLAGATSVENCASAGLTSTANSATDTQVSVEASGIGYGANLGLAYHPTKATTISVGYRSTVKYEMDGEAEFDHNGLENVALPQGFALSNFGLSTQDTTTDLDLPASLSLAFASQVSNKLTLHGDVTWTEWSSVPEIRIVFPDTVAIATPSITDLQWEDTIRVGAGLTYQLSQKTKLRAGIAHDPTPTPSAQHRTPRAPRADTMWYSAGVSHQVNKKISIDASMSLIVPDDTTIDYQLSPEESNYLTQADAESDAFSAALSVNYRFK